ncbi:MAG: helix-turn-helix domain containing protein [Bacteroidales bacterium]|jgi:AcrR family transcriptional regulator|nr:helix-turn-helix domain containing protein [Bacteroidales bacterium]
MTVEEKIVDRAHDLFVIQGIRRVTMDELAQSLGISKRTIYEHFVDKKTLVEEDAKFFYAIMKRETDRIIEEADNVIQGVTGVLRFVKGMLQVVTPVYFTDMKRYYPTAFEHISQKREIRKLDVTKILVKRGIDQGVFRPDLNVELVTFFLNGIVLTDHEVIGEISGLKYGDFERDIIFAYLLGVATEKGRVLIAEETEIYFSQMNMFGSEIPRYKF